MAENEKMKDKESKVDKRTDMLVSLISGMEHGHDQEALREILTFEWHESILILGLTELDHQFLGLLLLQLLPKVCQQLEHVVALKD